MGNQEYTVSEIKQNHIRIIAEIEKENFSEPWSEKSITESLNNSTVFFVAEKGDELIGYVGLQYILDEGYITSIAVKKENRNSGVATMLLNKCFSFAKEKHLAFISLEVRISNEKAINLYNKLDFKKEGLRKNFYRFPNEDAIIMTRRFI